MLLIGALVSGCSSGAANHNAVASATVVLASDTVALGTAVTPRPSTGCSQPPPPAGEAEQALAGGGTSRRLTPSAIAKSKPLPLIIDVHGSSVTAAQQAQISGFELLGEQRGAIVLTPSGAGPAPGTIDVDFLTRLLDASEQQLCVDTARVFMDGISGGGLLTSLAGCQLADRLAAIGVVSGIRFPPGCHPSRPLPMIIFHGKLDTELQYYGGIGYNFTHTDQAPPPPTTPPADTQGLPPVETVVAQWVAADGCAVTPAVNQVSPHVERRVFADCSGGSAVEFYVISDGSHTWPGFDPKTFQRLFGDRGLPPPTQEIQATPLLWAFWMQHPLPASASAP